MDDTGRARTGGWWRGGAHAMLLGSGLTACSYIFELTPSTPAEVTTAPTVDAGAADTSAPADAAEAAALGFCAGQTDAPVLCEDFDEEPPPSLASLGDVRTSGGGVLELALDVSVSRPRSLQASAPAALAAASVVRALGSNPSGVTWTFDLRPLSWGASSAGIAPLVLTEGDTECSLGLLGEAGFWALGQVCVAGGVETAKVTTVTNHPIVAETWQRFSVSLAFAPTRRVTLEIDGVRVVDVPPLDPMTETARTSVLLGIARVNQGSVRVAQDNLLLTRP